MQHNPHLSSAEHPHARMVHDLLAAFGSQDRGVIERLIAPDCVWRVPGQSSLAGEYVGRPAVIAFLGRLKRIFTGPAQFEIIDIATSADRAISYQYGTAVMDGMTWRFKECLVWRIADGRFVEVDEFQFDQASFDEAFTDADPLVNAT